MIDATIQLREFMSGTPVVDADVAVTLKVAPVFNEWISLPAPFTVKPFQRPVPDVSLAQEYRQRCAGAGDGRFTTSFELSRAFATQRARYRRGEEAVGALAVAEVHVGLPWLELDPTVPFLVPPQQYSDTRRRQVFFDDQGRLVGQGVKEDQPFDWPVAIDYVKTIVGHTTEYSTTLWFQLNGTLKLGYYCVCDIERGTRRAPSDDLFEFERAAPIDFTLGAADRCHTASMIVAGLEPSTPYRFTLWIRSTTSVDEPRTGKMIDQGRFTTAPGRGQFTTAPPRIDVPGGKALRIVFGSCHWPLFNTHEYDSSIERWTALDRNPVFLASEEWTTEEGRYDLMLLIGDQIYGDGLKPPWFNAYARRYHDFWTVRPMRDVLRRTPTYMIWDDHEVADDWGCAEIPGGVERIDAARRAYEIFQHDHNPRGFTHPQNVTQYGYSFNWGPASFFMLDGRSARDAAREAGAESRILGENQRRALRDWAKEERTRAADFIFFVSPVPIAFLPVEEIRRLVSEVRTAAKPWEILSTILWAVTGGLIDPIDVDKAIRGAGLADLTTLDLADMWTYEPNQADLVFVLDCLFDLANDVQPDGTLGPHRRAVFVLGGDVHSGSMHLIRSTRERHGRNPLIYHLTSSAISTVPTSDKTYQRIVRHIKENVSIDAIDLAQVGGDLEKLVDEKFGGDPALFALDSKGERRYWAQFVSLVTERNYGLVEISPVDVQSRVYQVRMSIETRPGTMLQTMRLDLGRLPAAVDLAGLAPRAGWTSGVLVDEQTYDPGTLAELTFDGAKGSPSGEVSVEPRELEDGRTERVLFTHPMWANRGSIKGLLPPVLVPTGARFEVDVGFVNGAAGSDGVTFQVWEHHSGNGYASNLVAQVTKLYTGTLEPIRADLSHLAGIEVTIELRVNAGQTSGQDWAVWLQPRVVSG